eukprot:CAMPEP_0185780276 /NCGR_PEP_ID=MMETSP1174-20130828/98597_1 /TAXON_ID=35687 /ORGANISM="Dictyocha speculum, Strain CCMP1381" /LENGTH=453 /DNA_ID=CAMNT_0028469777 /DNA_START=132 /DNA_END=1493 /DNA_ORIENTATION=+
MPTRSFFGVSFPDLTETSVTKLVEKQQISIPREELFKVVLDVSAYHEFLPFCANSQILHENSETCFDAELEIGFKSITIAYTSRVTFTHPTEIRARVIDSSVFSKMDSRWTFKESSPHSAATDVEFEIEFEVKNPMIASAVSTFFEDAARQQVQAFKARCFAMRHRVREEEQRKEGSEAAASTPSPPPSHTLTVKQVEIKESVRRGGVISWSTEEEGNQSEREMARVESALFEETRRHNINESQAGAGGGLSVSWAAFESTCFALRDLSGFTQMSENEALRRAVFSALQILEVDNKGISLPLEHVARTLFVLVQAPPLIHAKLLFTMIDLDHDGVLNRRELTRALERHMDAVGNAVRHLLRIRAEKRDSAEDRSRSVRTATAHVDSLLAEVRSEVPSAVQQLLDDFDVNRSGSISLKEWERGMKRHPELMEMMSVHGMSKTVALATAHHDIEI